MSTPSDPKQFQQLANDSIKIDGLTSTLGILYRNIYSHQKSIMKPKGEDSPSLEQHSSSFKMVREDGDAFNLTYRPKVQMILNTDLEDLNTSSVEIPISSSSQTSNNGTHPHSSLYILEKIGNDMIEQCPQLLENINKSNSYQSLYNDSLTDEQIGESLIKTIEIFTQSDDTFLVLQSMIKKIQTEDYNSLGINDNKIID